MFIALQIACKMSLPLIPRENRGIKVKETYTEAEYNRALKIRWVFFCRKDKSVFPLYLTHQSWPPNYGFHDKMNIQKSTVLTLKTDEGYDDCQFVETCPAKDYDARSKRAMTILDRCEKNNISLAEITMSL